MNIGGAVLANIDQLDLKNLLGMAGRKLFKLDHWEAEKEMKDKWISARLPDEGGILGAVFSRWGIALKPKQ